MAWTAELLVNLLAVGQAWLVIQSFEQQGRGFHNPPTEAVPFKASGE